MRTIILDSSFLLSYILPDEKMTDPVVYRELKSNEVILAEPYLFSYEVLNGIRSAFLRSRVRKDELEKLVKSFSDLTQIVYYHPTGYQRLYDLATKNNLSIYDASYLWLKKETGYPLYSLDSRLSKLS